MAILQTHINPEQEGTKARSLKAHAGPWIVKSFFSSESASPFWVGLFGELFSNAISIFIQAQPVTCNEVIAFLFWPFLLCGTGAHNPCFILLKALSVRLYCWASFGLISQPMTEQGNELMDALLDRSTPFFRGPPFPLVFKRRAALSSSLRHRRLILRAARRRRHGGQCPGKTRSLSANDTFDWQPPALEGGMPGWKVLCDNSCKADLLHSCSWVRYSVKCLLLPRVWKGTIWLGLNTLPSTAPRILPLSCWGNGRFSVSDLKINRALLLHRSFQNKLSE